MLTAKLREYQVLAFMFFLIVLSKVTGFGKDLLLSYYHGATSVTDAYFIASSIASLSYAALYMAIPVVVVPYVVRLIGNDSLTNGRINVLPILQSFIIISIAISALVFIGAEYIVNSLFPDTGAETKQYVYDFVRIIALTFILSTVVAIYNAVQVVKKKRVSSLIVPIVNNGAFIIAIFIFRAANDFIYVLLAGVFAWVLLLVLNYIITKNDVSYDYSMELPLFNDRKLLLVFLPAFFVFYVEQFNSYVSVFFASGLESGAVSFLSYANKVSLLLVSLFIVFLNIYAFPKLADKYLQAEKEMNDFLTEIIRLIAIFCFPIVFVLFGFSEQVITMLFGRGQLTTSDVAAVATVFQVLVISLPLLLLRDLLNRAIFAHDNASLSLMALVVSVIIHIVVVKYYMISYGLYGIAAGVVVSAFINCILLIAFLRLFFNIKLIKNSLKTIFICLSLLVALKFLSSWCFANASLDWRVEGAILVVSYFCCLYTLKEEQFRNIISSIALSDVREPK